MATPRGEVTIESLGMTWRLKFGTGAMCRLEDWHQPSGISEIIGSVQTAKGGVRVSILVDMLFAGLLDNHPDVTRQAVIEIIDDIGRDAVLAPLGDAIKAAFPEKKEGASRPQTATAE